MIKNKNRNIIQKSIHSKATRQYYSVGHSKSSTGCTQQRTGGYANHTNTVYCH